MKYSKLIRCLTGAFLAWIAVSFFVIKQVDSHVSQRRYDKVSVDNTPLFIYTDRNTGCRFVYDATTKEISATKGYEHCPLPAALQQ